MTDELLSNLPVKDRFESKRTYGSETVYYDFAVLDLREMLVGVFECEFGESAERLRWRGDASHLAED